MAPTPPKSGLFVGLNKGHIVTTKELAPRPSARKRISNTYGELSSLAIQNPQFKWIEDLSKFDKLLTITPGNNGLLYITFSVMALLLVLDVSTGNISWQKNIGPLSTTDCSPTVDSNGWISIGSLDGFMYSFSPSVINPSCANCNIFLNGILTSFISHFGFERKTKRVENFEVTGKVEKEPRNFHFYSNMKNVLGRISE